MPLSRASTLEFSDVPSNHKNRVAIEYLAEKGVLQGYSDGTFKPDQTVNRAELLKVLVEGEDITPAETTYNNCFPDVKSDWYAKYVCFAKEQGWIQGYSDGTFQPAQTVNKVEAIKMLIETYGLSNKMPETVTETLYTDTDNTAWYAKYISLAKTMALLEETGVIFDPSGGMRRAGIAENLYRLLYIQENDLVKFPAVIYENPEVVYETPSKTTDITLTGGDILFFDETVTRPEFCFIENKVYATFRHSIDGAQAGQRVNEMVMKVFDVNEDGYWTDGTKETFGDDFFLLYPANGEDGSFTDQQLMCYNNDLYVLFEAGKRENGETVKYTVIHRYSTDGVLKAKNKVLSHTGDLADETGIKGDDPGLAILNNTLFTWSIKLEQRFRGTAFLMYGLDPETLEITVYDEKKGNENKEPLELPNPTNSSFNGTLDFYDGVYHLVTSPFDPEYRVFATDGLVDNQYDSNWKFLKYELADHEFDYFKPIYVTGQTHNEKWKVWGFTLEDPAVRPTGPKTEKTAAYQNTNNVGEAWIRVENNEREYAYFKVSDNDPSGDANSTRHTEVVFYKDFLYVGYKHVVESNSAVIRRYQISEK